MIGRRRFLSMLGLGVAAGPALPAIAAEAMKAPAGKTVVRNWLPGSYAEVWKMKRYSDPAAFPLKFINVVEAGEGYSSSPTVIRTEPHA